MKKNPAKYRKFKPAKQTPCIVKQANPLRLFMFRTAWLLSSYFYNNAQCGKRTDAAYQKPRKSPVQYRTLSINGQYLNRPTFWRHIALIATHPLFSRNAILYHIRLSRSVLHNLRMKSVQPSHNGLYNHPAP